jgi:vacuole morphology and inheritance protein 14
MEKTKESPPVEFMEIMPVIKEMLTVKKSNTAESALIWMRNLLQLFSSKLLPTINDVLSKLIEKLQVIMALIKYL